MSPNHPPSIRHSSSNWQRLADTKDVFFQQSIYDNSLQHLIWKPTTDGKFSLTSAWNINRYCKPRSFIMKSCWQKSLPQKCSILMVKILAQRIPIDTTLYRFGIQGPSKCFCCNSPAEESVDHLFVSGEYAHHVWSFFEGPLGIRSAAISVRRKLMRWWLPKGKNKYLSFVLQILPSLVCWQIWKSRNLFIFEGKKESPLRCTEKKFFEFISLFKINFPFFPSFAITNWSQFISMLESERTQYQIRITNWQFPPKNSLKLNTKAYVNTTNGSGGGGGILRDDQGNFVLAFAAFFTSVTSVIEAETKTMDFGITICRQKGFSHLRLETDSFKLVEAIKHSNPPTWKLRREFQSIMNSCKDPRLISHCFGEANTIAEILAKHGYGLQKTICFDSSTLLPHPAKGLLALERLGLAYIRLHKR